MDLDLHLPNLHLDLDVLAELHLLGLHLELDLLADPQRQPLKMHLVLDLLAELHLCLHHVHPLLKILLQGRPPSLPVCTLLNARLLKDLRTFGIGPDLGAPRSSFAEILDKWQAKPSWADLMVFTFLSASITEVFAPSEEIPVEATAPVVVKKLGSFDDE